MPKCDLSTNPFNSEVLEKNVFLVSQNCETIQPDLVLEGTSIIVANASIFDLVEFSTDGVSFNVMSQLDDVNQTAFGNNFFDFELRITCGNSEPLTWVLQIDSGGGGANSSLIGALAVIENGSSVYFFRNSEAVTQNGMSSVSCCKEEPINCPFEYPIRLASDGTNGPSYIDEADLLSGINASLPAGQQANEINADCSITICYWAGEPPEYIVAIPPPPDADILLLEEDGTLKITPGNPDDKGCNGGIVQYMWLIKDSSGIILSTYGFNASADTFPANPYGVTGSFSALAISPYQISQDISICSVVETGCGESTNDPCVLIEAKRKINLVDENGDSFCTTETGPIIYPLELTLGGNTITINDETELLASIIANTPATAATVDGCCIIVSEWDSEPPVELIAKPLITCLVPGDGTTNWQNVVNVTTGNGTLQGPATIGWTKGASFGPVNNDFQLTFSHVNPSATENGMFGVSCNDTNQSYASIAHAFYLYGNTSKGWRIYESGLYQGVQGTFNNGDTFEIKRTGTTVEYFINGSVVHTSSNPVSCPVYFDSSIYRNSSIEKIELCGTA